MRTMQEKITETIRGAVEDGAGLELTQQADYANTGYLFAQDDLDTLLIIRYSFQPDHCSLDLSGAAVGKARLPDNSPVWRVEAAFPGEVRFYALKYADGDRLRVMLSTVTSLLFPYAK